MQHAYQRYPNYLSSRAELGIGSLTLEQQIPWVCLKDKLSVSSYLNLEMLTDIHL